MHFSAKVKMLEHASNIVKHIFQIRKIIIPNYGNPLSASCSTEHKAENWAAAFFFFFFLLKLICGYLPLAGVFLMRKG